MTLIERLEKIGKSHSYNVFYTTLVSLNACFVIINLVKVALGISVLFSFIVVLMNLFPVVIYIINWDKNMLRLKRNKTDA